MSIFVRALQWHQLVALVQECRAESYFITGLRPQSPASHCMTCLSDSEGPWTPGRFRLVPLPLAGTAVGKPPAACVYAGRA